MKIKWQWFLGGQTMFWIASILLIVLVFAIVVTYIIDPTTSIYMKVQSIDETSIKEMSESYVKSLGITISKPISYRFVKYQHEDGFKKRKSGSETVLLGTFHEWNNCYYIDISANLYRMNMLYEIVKHETRHMIVQELKNEKIIDLTEYTEEIAQEKNEVYNNLFNCGVKLLKEEQNNGEI